MKAVSRCVVRIQKARPYHAGEWSALDRVELDHSFEQIPWSVSATILKPSSLAEHSVYHLSAWSPPPLIDALSTIRLNV